MVVRVEASEDLELRIYLPGIYVRGTIISLFSVRKPLLSEVRPVYTHIPSGIDLVLILILVVTFLEPGTSHSKCLWSLVFLSYARGMRYHTSTRVRTSLIFAAVIIVCYWYFFTFTVMFGYF